MKITEKIIKRFFSKVTVAAGCWLWNAAKSKHGYGSFCVLGKTFRAHRISWVIKNGDILDNLFVLHKCDNPSCVNPEHLFLGTQKDNIIDCVNKGRNARGNVHPKSKLTNEQVLKIKALKNKCTAIAIARIFGVDRSTINQIHRGQIWK